MCTSTRPTTLGVSIRRPTILPHWRGLCRTTLHCTLLTRNGESLYNLCLLTCASTRAVHSRDLGIETFLLSLRRFASRRGLPATIISDNAKTFKASSKEVSKIIRSDEVQRYFTRNRIKWKFIAEKVPWLEFFWKHLV